MYWFKLTNIAPILGINLIKPTTSKVIVGKIASKFKFDLKRKKTIHEIAKTEKVSKIILGNLDIKASTVSWWVAL